jgi:hypothetical protein
MMMPTYDSDGTFLPKVSGVQQLRMSLHERLCATTLLYLSRTRTPPSRSQHLDSCTLHDHVGARISLLGRGCGALSAAWYNETRKVRFERFVVKLAHLRLESASSTPLPLPMNLRDAPLGFTSISGAHALALLVRLSYYIVRIALCKAHGKATSRTLTPVSSVE